jgi:hypothetical protein
LNEIEAGDSVRLVAERAGNRVNLDVETEAGSGWSTSIGPGGNNLRIFSRTDRDGDDGFQFNWAPLVDGTNVNVLRSIGFASSPWGELELVAVTDSLGRYFDTSEGLLVVSAPDSGAPDIDIQEGDVILSISGRQPNSPEHAIRILSSFEAGETIELSIMRDRRRQSIEYEIPASANAPAQVYPNSE